MVQFWRRVVIGSAIAVYLLGLGCAGGLLAQHAWSGAIEAKESGR